ncbi:UNVERIFIED_CONTAM: hypothetical protein HDU68_011243, partial [Siphonaria sp. JEL0065]
MRARRESVLRSMGEIDIGNGVRVNVGDFGLDAEFGTRQPEMFPHPALIRRRTDREFGRGILGPEGQTSYIRTGWNPDIDPILFAMLNDNNTNFWAPVDPVTVRDSTEGAGVKEEEWEKMRVYTYGSDEKVRDIEKDPIIPPAEDSADVQTL